MFAVFFLRQTAEGRMYWLETTRHCIDPVNSCTGVNVEGKDDEHPDGRRHQALDGQAGVAVENGI